ncbi:MAG: SOS response-associated peptidase [Ardenticatenaceae bacterium]|nr:SOS response-associated peptidase [Ardenticatenaceae bacterium]MCB8990095.1 SOS response-associated peptidase [Ardenticatenaceae bacterium]
MCGRFALLTPGEIIAKAFAIDTIPEPLPPRYNIAPTQPVLAVRLSPHNQQREFALFRWGLVPSWSKDIKIGARMINARAETAAEKPSFRTSFKRRRCLIPASGFYEWQKVNGRKQPMYIYPENGGIFAFAGLWEYWQSADGSELQTCTILTTTPNDLMASIHNRMPVIVEPADFDMWLHPGPRSDDAHHLLRPYPADKMAAYAVSTAVNSPANDNPTCIAPL